MWSTARHCIAYAGTDTVLETIPPAPKNNYPRTLLLPTGTDKMFDLVVHDGNFRANIISRQMGNNKFRLSTRGIRSNLATSDPSGAWNLRLTSGKQTVRWGINQNLVDTISNNYPSGNTKLTPKEQRQIGRQKLTSWDQQPIGEHARLHTTNDL